MPPLPVHTEYQPRASGAEQQHTSEYRERRTMKILGGPGALVFGLLGVVLLDHRDEADFAPFAY